MTEGIIDAVVKLVGNRVLVIATDESRHLLLELSLTEARHMADLLARAVQVAEDRAMGQPHDR